MKKIAAFLLLGLILGAYSLRVARIEVYPGGARVYLQGSVGEDGMVRFSPLPTDISEIFSSHPDFAVKELVNREIPEEALKVKKRYVKYKKKMEALKSKLEALERREKFYQEALDSLSRSFSRRITPGWERILQDFSARLSRIKGELVLVRKEREALAPEFDMARREWESVKPSVEKAKMIVVRGNPGEKVTLSFNTGAVSMGIFYRVEAHLDSTRVLMKSLCRLNSRIPADLTAEVYLLPTKPLFHISLPRQNRWDIVLWKPYPQRRIKGLEARPQPMVARPLKMKVPRPQPKTVGLYRTVFLGRRRVKFGENKFPVFSRALEGKMTWEAYPALSSRVFVVFRGKNTTGFHLPAAPALFFINGILTRRDRIKAVGTNQPLELLLGEDPNFTVKYERKVVERNRGIMKSGMVLAREVTLRNSGEREREVVVKLPLPYPVDREIKVQDRITPPPSSVDKDRIAMWRMKIAPGEVKKINLVFKIIYPKGKEVSGTGRF